jgi:hypothetical protein
MDRDQEPCEQANKMCEDEGCLQGQHHDHWQRAEDQHEATEREAAEVIEANERASDADNDKKSVGRSSTLDN